MSPFKTLLISPLPPPVGGIATWTELMCRAARRRDDVQVRVLDTANRWRRRTMPGALTRLRGGSIQAIGTTARFIVTAFRHRPDLVHICTSGSFSFVRDCLLLTICRILRIPSVLHFHFGRIPDLAVRRGWEWHLLQLALRLADVCVALDAATLRAMKESGHSRIMQLPNMIALDDLPNVAAPLANKVPPRPSVPAFGHSIIFLGHAVVPKGIRELVRASRRLRERYPALTLTVVGPSDEPLRSELIEMAGGAGADAWFSMTGPVQRAKALAALAQGDIFCLPTYSEGFPYVIMEAMALAKPIVSTPVGAIAEMLDIGGPGECGIVVPPGDEEALEHALDKVLRHPAEAREMADRARARCAAEYSLDKVFQKWMAIWRGIARHD